jgi:hypothetical protein
MGARRTLLSTCASPAIRLARCSGVRAHAATGLGRRRRGIVHGVHADAPPSDGQAWIRAFAVGFTCQGTVGTARGSLTLPPSFVPRPRSLGALTVSTAPRRQTPQRSRSKNQVKSVCGGCAPHHSPTHTHLNAQATRSIGGWPTSRQVSGTNSHLLRNYVGFGRATHRCGIATYRGSTRSSPSCGTVCRQAMP